MTFSLCTYVPSADHDAGEGPAFAVAVATDAPAVGALCPYVSHEGAVATQSFVNVRLGRNGIRLLADLAVDDALPGLLEQDEHSDLRQLHGVDYRGNAFAFTGENCDEWCGHQVHDDAGVTDADTTVTDAGTTRTDAETTLTAAGNMLTGEETLDAVGDAFVESDGRLVERLLDALDAGVTAGGDKRGHSSAAVLVKAPQTTAYHDLRVDEHETPVAELRRVYEAAYEASDGFSEESKERIFD